MAPILSNRFSPGQRAYVAAFFLLVTSAFACGDDDGSAPGASGGDGGAAGSSWSCERGCELALDADCPMGPPSQAQCEADCEQNLAGDCGTEYAALMRCAEGEAITCREDGFLVIAACSTEQDAFVACAN